jgi:hypothetical protein
MQELVPAAQAGGAQRQPEWNGAQDDLGETRHAPRDPPSGNEQRYVEHERKHRDIEWRMPATSPVKPWPIPVDRDQKRDPRERQGSQ